MPLVSIKVNYVSGNAPTLFTTEGTDLEKQMKELLHSIEAAKAEGSSPFFFSLENKQELHFFNLKDVSSIHLTFG